MPVHQGVSTGPPPTYEETTDPNGIDLDKVNIYSEHFPFSAGPPSYESLFRQISSQLSDAAQRNGSDFRKLIFVLVGLLIFMFVMFIISIVLGLPLSLITIGSIHLHDCPAQPNIPVFLIVAGNE